ncbi:MAG: cysteine-rich CWC family protein [Pseudomonadota bacterium]|nr:cysteine-rich CWC family protein [Pseudomonadota bacterium]
MNDTRLPPPDPARCPLCGQPNGCAVHQARASGQPQPPCWCTHVRFTEALLARVPPAARRRTCICAACATASHAADGQRDSRDTPAAP